jgi:hypothetical protein
MALTDLEKRANAAGQEAMRRRTGQAGFYADVMTVVDAVLQVVQPDLQQAEARATTAELALGQARTVLEWYGDADNWVCEDHHVGHCGPEDCSLAIDSDEGQRARAALAATDGQGAALLDAAEGLEEAVRIGISGLTICEQLAGEPLAFDAARGSRADLEKALAAWQQARRGGGEAPEGQP